MKKIFTLIATALMAVSVNAQTESVVYTLDNKAETYVLGDYTEASTYTLDGVEGFAVNYTGADATNNKMQIKLADNETIFFEYGNSSAKNNAFKTSPIYAQFDSKNYVINVPLKESDILAIKFSAKGSSNPSTMGIYGSDPCIELHETAADNLVSKATTDYKVIKFVATKGGTAKIKETTGGARIYAIAVNEEIPEATGINEIISAVKAGKARKVVKNGRLVIETANGAFSATGARIK